MRAGERGVALLEVLVALTIFATAALGLVSLLAQSAEHERRAEDAERVLADEERLMTALSLLLRSDLDLRLGSRTAGPYVVEVQRPAAALYRVSIARADAPAAPDLVTLAYRPEPAR